MSEANGCQQERGPRRYLRPAILLALLLVALWALAPQAAEIPRVAGHFRNARPLPLLLALLMQVARYLGAGLLISLCARSAGKTAPALVSASAALASGAAARIVPVGGAGGLAVRYSFLKRRGLDEASIGGYFVLQNVLGTATLVIVFAASLLYTRLSGGGSAGLAAVVPALATIAGFVALYLWLSRRPADAARAGAAAGRIVEALAARLLRRALACERSFAGAVTSLAHTLTFGGGGPARLALALFYSSWTIVGDIASLHFATIAVGSTATVATTVVAYALSSFAASAAAMPAGLGVTEGALVATYAGAGASLDLALSQVLLFRALSFWLPLPLGGLAGWWLRRRGAI